MSDRPFLAIEVIPVVRRWADESLREWTHNVGEWIEHGEQIGGVEIEHPRFLATIRLYGRGDGDIVVTGPNSKQTLIFRSFQFDTATAAAALLDTLLLELNAL